MVKTLPIAMAVEAMRSGVMYRYQPKDGSQSRTTQPVMILQRTSVD